MRWIGRILSVFGGLILLGIAILFVLSRSADVGKVHFAIEINASPERIYPWLERGDKAKQWVSWLVETRPVGSNSSGVGSKEIWVMKDPNMANQLIPIEGTCIEYAPPHRLAVELSSPAFTGSQSYTLTALAPERTRLEVDANYSFPGWSAKLAQPLIMPAAKKKLEGDLARLKQRIESSTS